MTQCGYRSNDELGLVSGEQLLKFVKPYEMSRCEFDYFNRC